MTDVFGSSCVNSTPSLGADLKCRTGATGGSGGSDTGATANAGIYRYATEDLPPLPLDNQAEKIAIYEEFTNVERDFDNKIPKFLTNSVLIFAIFITCEITIISILFTIYFL